MNKYGMNGQIHYILCDTRTQMKKQRAKKLLTKYIANVINNFIYYQSRVQKIDHSHCSLTCYVIQSNSIQTFILEYTYNF